MRINPLNRYPLTVLFFLALFFPILKADVTVKTYHDQNNNGQRDAGEGLISGLTVTATDAQGNEWPFLDDGAGTHILPGDVIVSRLRVQVTGYAPGLLQGVAGPTSVFYVEDGDEVEVSISTGPNFNSLESDIMVPCYDGGPADQNTGPAFVSFPYDVNGIAASKGGQAADPSTDATIQQIGSTWGVGYQHERRRAFTSALVKRHVGLGPENEGGLYVIDYSSGTPQVSSLSLQNVGPSVGPTIDLGSIPRVNVTGDVDGSMPHALTYTPNTATYDLAAFDGVGKIAFGDIDVFGDELWMVNLHQRSLIVLDISGEQVTASSAALRHYPILSMTGLPNLNYAYSMCINAGGNLNGTGAEPFTDQNKVSWDKNKYSSGGGFGYKAFKVNNELSAADATSEGPLYQTFRKGTFSYNIPVPTQATYQVTLHFAEPNNFVAGDRLFDIAAEGQVMYTDFDIVARAQGANRATTVTFDVQSDGNNEINLDFTAKIGNKVSEAILSGVEITGGPIMPSGELRPWGLSFNQGRGYLGVVADASTSQSRDHLFGFVLSFDPSNMEAGFTEELAFPLAYPRERASNAHLPSPQPLRSAEWQPWIQNWEQTAIMQDQEQKSTTGALLCAYAQPIISDIDFVADGSGFVIGLMDRFAHQTGYLNYPPVLDDQTLLVSYGAGDVIRAFDDQGIYRLEQSADVADNGQFFRNDDGPSFAGEFFYEDHFVAAAAHHGEIFTGGMGILPGSGEVVSTVFNPIVTNTPQFENSGVYTQGVQFYNTGNGTKERAYLFVDQFISGKANGLGDMEFASALIGGEIGNYVWCDGNGNGIQDPEEFGIDGVTLTLHDKENMDEQVDMTTTANGGEFIFTNILPNHCYSIRIDLSQLTIAGYSGLVPDPFQGGDTLFDSNGDPNMIPGFSVAMFCSGPVGTNDHSIDFAFLGPEARECTLVECVDQNGCASFDLSDLMDCARALGNTTNIVGIYEDLVNDSLVNEITTGPIMVCTGMDSCVYARVSISNDTMCYAISKITLSPLDLDGIGMIEYQRVICLGATLDLSQELTDFNLDYQAGTEMFYSDAAKTMPLPQNFQFNILPDTAYFSANLSSGQQCMVMGTMIYNQIPFSFVNAGMDDTICGLECVDLTSIGAIFNANGSGATMAEWTRLGGGGLSNFVDDNTFAGARLYCPDSMDLLNGQVTLLLSVLDDPCGPQPPDSVVITIQSGAPQLVPGTRDTIDCIHPFASEQTAENDTFPGCRMVFQCVDTMAGEVESYDLILGDCENIVKQIKRTFKIIYNKQEYFCMDTIAVRALPDTLICPPERDSVYCHTGYLKDENGHPSPLETGVPMADSIPLWPAPPSICDISIKYKDFDFHDQCPNTIRREWFIKNNCTGAFDSCVQWIMIFDTIGPTFTGIDTNAFIVATPSNSHECIAETYIPWVEVEDTCTDIKQVKAIVSGVGTVVLSYNEDEDRWESHEKIEIPLAQLVFDDGFEVQNIAYITYEAVDECHNKTTLESIPLIAVDDTKPVTICDKGVNVTVSDSIIWVPAETFDEGSWDNCGIEVLLARRVDWASACGMDLCDSLIYVCETDHHDSLWCAVIEADKHINPVEAHYQQAIEWLCEDGRACTLPFLLGWAYDLIQYGTKECREHPYPVDADFVDQMINECISEFGFILPCFKAFDQDSVAIDVLLSDTSTFYENLIGDILKIADLGFFIGSEYTLLDIGKQIGGGWSDAVPFCCEDACEEVVVEVLAMDYWCNWSKCWTTVKVEDKTPPEVVCELFDVTVSCASYKTYYQDAVEMALAGDFDSLQSVLGTYDKVQFDDYDNVPPKTSFDIYELNCDSNLVEKDSLVYDEHLGYVWKTFTYYRAEYDTTVRIQYNGQVADNCGLQCIEEKPWVEIDACGNGRVTRVFKFVGQCTIEGSGHVADTIRRTQTIWILPDCEISKAMFEVPKDTLVYDCGITYLDDGSGNVAGSASPSSTGEAQYVFDNDCRLVGIGYYDKVFRIVGGDQGCYKILRTWCFADWCAIGGEPDAKEWWWDPYYDGKLLKYTQKIIVIDSTPPICTIDDIPEVVETQGCYYTLTADVQVEDECGVLKYSWKVTDTKTLEVFASGQGDLNSEESDAFSVLAEDLPAGTYSLKVSVTDECQNESICDRIFTVDANKKPSPVCLTSITVELNPMDTDNDGSADTAMAVVWADEYDQSSIASCGSSQESLVFLIDDGQGEPELPDVSATSLEVGCDHVGPNTIRMYVLDENGAWDYCEVILIVQNNMGGCGDISANNGLVSGQILTEQQDLVELVDVSIEHSSGGTMLETEDVGGTYQFVLPKGLKAVIRPTKNTDPDNGVSTRDLISIQKEILGKANLETWYQLRAADANDDGAISALDLIQLRKLILGKIDELPNSMSWRFYEKETNQQAYLIDGMPESMEVDFIGVKIGDVNGDNNPARRMSRSVEHLVLHTDDLEIEAGQTRLIPFRSSDFVAVEGLQLTLAVNPNRLQIMGLQGEALPLSEEHWHLSPEGDLAAIAWNESSGKDLTVSGDEVLFYLELSGMANGQLSEAMAIGDRVVEAESYPVGQPAMPISIAFDGLQADSEFALYQNRPNPFDRETSIGFTIPQSGEVTISIFDVTGKVVEMRSGDAIRGYNEWRFTNLDNGLTSGLLYYKIEADEYTAVRRMVLMK